MISNESRVFIVVFYDATSSNNIGFFISYRCFYIFSSIFNQNEILFIFVIIRESEWKVYGLFKIREENILQVYFHFSLCVLCVFQFFSPPRNDDVFETFIFWDFFQVNCNWISNELNLTLRFCFNWLFSFARFYFNFMNNFKTF